MPLPVEKHEKQYKTNYAITQKFKRDMNDESLEYLYGRGISDKEIEEWLIGYDKAENRIVFPLMDPCKNIIGFNKRLITKETKGISRKYLHSSDSEVFKKSNYLYGMHNINNTCNYIVLSEGVFDVILSRKYGLKNVVCALGTSLSDYQMELLAKQKKEVIVVYDNDTKGIKTMKKVLPLLEEKNIPAKLLLLPEGKDLADSALLLKYDIEDYILNNSITYGYYKLQDTVNMFNRDLYNLYNKYNSIFKDIENSVPESEKHTIAAFINNNIYNKEISINAMR
jgi:DNA primase catalytic core